MMQKREKEQKVVIPNLPLLQAPRLFLTFFKYHNILTSERLWVKIAKMLSFEGECEINDLLQNLQLESSSNLQSLNSKLTIMGVLALLAVAWLKVGKAPSTQSSYQQSSLAAFLKLSQAGESNQLQLEVRSKHPANLEETELQINQQQIPDMAKQTSTCIQNLISILCGDNGFQFDQRFWANGVVYINSQQQLTFDSIHLPSILEVSVNKTQTSSKLLMKRQGYPTKANLNLQEYTQLIKYFEQVAYVEAVMPLRSFVNLYCEKVKKMLEEKKANHTYYFNLSPKTVLVVQSKDKDQIAFQFNQVGFQLYFYDGKKIPTEVKDSIYFDKSLNGTEKKSLEKADAWSLGLTILTPIAPYDSSQFLDLFQQYEDKGLRSRFLHEQVQVLTQKGDTLSQSSLKILKQWLKLNQSEAKDKVSILQQPKTGQKEVGLEWLKKVIPLSTTNSTQGGVTANQPARSPSQEKNVEFIRSIPNLAGVKKTGYETKTYTVYSSSSSTSYSRDSFSNSYNIKTVNYNNQAKADPLAKKGPVDENKWERDLEKIKKFATQYQQIYMIFGTKMTPEMILRYQQMLYKNKNVYEDFGYYSKGPIKITTAQCQECKLQSQLITDYCGHSRCQLCYTDYVSLKINQRNFSFLVCPDSHCNQIVSLQLMETVLSKNKNQRALFLSQVMKLQVMSNKERSIKRCKCSPKASYFEIVVQNRLFLCEICVRYNCVHCGKLYHGSVPCDQAFKNGQLHEELVKKLKQLDQSKSSLDAKSQKTYQQLLMKKLNMKENMFAELEAMLKVCVCQQWAVQKMKRSIFEKNAQNSEITQQVIAKLVAYLSNFYSKIKTTKEINKISQESVLEMEKMQELHRLSGAILHIAIV